MQKIERNELANAKVAGGCGCDKSAAAEPAPVVPR